MTISQYNNDPKKGYFAKTAQAESTNDVTQQNPFGAAGKYQFLESTWMGLSKQYNLGYNANDRFDPVKSEKVMKIFTDLNTKHLQKRLGREPNDTELYLAHFLGAGGATSFIKAEASNPNQNTTDYFSPIILKQNKNVMYNKDGTPKKLKDIRTYASTHMGKPAPKQSSNSSETTVNNEQVIQRLINDQVKLTNFAGTTISDTFVDKPEEVKTAEKEIVQAEVQKQEEEEQQAIVQQQQEEAPQEDLYGSIQERFLGIENFVDNPIMQDGGTTRDRFASNGRDSRQMELLMKEIKLIDEDKKELQKTGQIKTPRSLQFKKSAPKPQPTVKQDNRSNEQRNISAEAMQKANNGTLALERPLIYAANPTKLLGDLGVGKFLGKPNLFETSEQDREQIMLNRYNPNQSSGQRFQNNLEMGLGYVPEATVNVGLAMVGMENPTAGRVLNEAINPFAGIKTGVSDEVRQGLRGNSFFGDTFKGNEKPTEELVDLYRIQQKNAKTFAQKAEDGTLNKWFNNPETLARKAEEEKYFGQWFTKDKADLDWYKADREFTDPEIINLKVPKSKLEQYNQYDKSLSRAPDREFVIPFEEQTAYRQGQGEAFKSEINWGNWNKEIPNNSNLMKEYEAIEQTTKANGTWMKNPDGSKFTGTKPTQKELDFHKVGMSPDEAVRAQFIQQNSSGIKNNMSNAIKDKSGSLQSNYHNSDSRFDSFDERYFSRGSGDDGWYGKGNYTSPDSNYTDPYGNNKYSFYINSENPGIINKKNIYEARFYNRTKDEIYNNIDIQRNELIRDSQKSPLGSFMRSGVTEFPSIIKNGFKKHYDNVFEESVKSAQLNQGSLDKFTSLHNPYNKETVTPFSNYLKSAIGNNGMFDMSNPNIYKSVAPISLVVAGAIKLEQKQKGGTIPISSRGMYEYPNQKVIVPTKNGSITMSGIDHPILAKSLQTGEQKILMPNLQYFFDRTTSVLETPLKK